MSRTTLCLPPAGWEERIKELRKQEFPEGRLLLEVELALELMFSLNLEGETVLAIPAVLSATPMFGQDFTDAQRFAIANVRQITGFSASSAWRTALSAYRRLPDEWRHYDLSSGPGEEDGATEADDEDTENAERDDYEKRLICIARKPDGALRHGAHTQLYEKCLTTILPFRERCGIMAKAEILYTFRAETEGGESEELHVEYPPELLKIFEDASRSWFDPYAERERGPITINIHRDLAPIAAFFDAQDAKHDLNFHWRERLAGLRYRRITKNGEPDEAAPDILEMNGFHHAAGMVASGKSTLAFLIAGYIIDGCLTGKRPDQRVTLVISDVQTALRLTHQLNRYFRRDPENDMPVAVPLLGRSQRGKHLRDLHASADWQKAWEKGEPHWGERFLSVACPLQALIPAEEIARRFGGRELKMQPGREPCASLNPPKTRKKKRRFGEAGEDERPQRHLCPLYARCPSHRAVHDMPNAPVWIITPQAMTQGGAPRQAETRPVHLGEIVYEQSDLVIFDEADAVMGIFDETFARDEDLSNGRADKGGGVYDRIGMQTERFAIAQRASLSPAQQRWSHAQRGGQSASQILLALLRDNDLPFRRWVARQYFTPHVLFGRFARRLAGCTESRPPDEEDAETKNRIDYCRAPFDRLFGRGVDPLNPKRLRDDLKLRDTLDFDLWMLLRDMDADSGAIFSDALFDRAKKWIESIAPDYAEREKTLRQRLRREAEEQAQADGKKKRGERYAAGAKAPDADVDTIERLAYRLIFVLTAALLDRHTHTIFLNWRSRTAPDEDDTEPHQNTPKILRDVLPLPPLGRQFGTYYSPGDESGVGNPNRLSFLSYTNIGRWYLLHFHELFRDLRQRPGPNVLALSGTSYLPDSVRLHVGSYRTRPQGLLLPEEEAKRAIRQSEFTFLPVRDDTGKAIRLSGAREGAEKTAALQTLAQKLARPSGHLRRELVALKEKGTQKPDFWGDRERILLLVNSYDQARIVALSLRDAWHEERDRIFYLSRPEPADRKDNPFVYDLLRGGPSEAAGERNSLYRSDIENFGTQTDGRILIAPMNAIGRGYNILNRADRAAFGAIYFLFRPYPHPDDMTALARELNRRALDWAETENFPAWNHPTLEKRFYALRRAASDYWDDAQWRSYWRTLNDRTDLLCYPRRDLAAHTAGLLVQAAGRLLRGGVPFRAYFVDAAFAPLTAKLSSDEGDDKTPPDKPALQERQDSPQTSLLAAVITLMRDLVAEDSVAKALYEPLADALLDTRFRESFFPQTHDWTKQEKNNA